MLWADRFVPPELLTNRTTALRARVVVCATCFATPCSLIAQSIRLHYEVQHWIPLLSWTVCTFLFIITPFVLRLTRKLWLSASLVSLALVIAAVGVGVMEGGVSSPNAIILLIGPIVATLLGGWRSGVAIEFLAIVLCVALWFGHRYGVISPEVPMATDTLFTMRATVLASLSFAAFLLTMFYEVERDRSEAELSEQAVELAAARDAVAAAAETKIELLASQRRELERDLQLTAAVQKLLLPKQDSFDTECVSVAGFSVTAAQAGGDWWFAEPLPDGGVRIVLGDVTGHGAAPAMVAAVVAGAFRAMQERAQHVDPRALLEVLHTVARGVSTGLYTMPFGLLDVTCYGRALWLSAAAPPLLVLRRDGAVDSITVPGTPLGGATFSLGEKVFDLSVGERILLTSDGVSELRLAGGYDLGLRRLGKLFRSTGSVSVASARDEIAERLDHMRGSEPLHDDVTFAIAELRAVRAQRVFA